MFPLQARCAFRKADKGLFGYEINISLPQTEKGVSPRAAVEWKCRAVGGLKPGVGCIQRHLLKLESDLMKRTSAYYREMAWRHAIRKRRIAREVYPESPGWDYYPNLHQFSKNKIHCSCPFCSAKTRNKGKRRKNAHGFSPSINYKISDLKKIQRLEFSEEDFQNFDFSENL